MHAVNVSCIRCYCLPSVYVGHNLQLRCLILLHTKHIFQMCLKFLYIDNLNLFLSDTRGQCIQIILMLMKIW